MQISEYQISNSICFFISVTYEENPQVHTNILFEALHALVTFFRGALRPSVSYKSTLMATAFKK